jgi:hypothetical protein
MTGVAVNLAAVIGTVDSEVLPDGEDTARFSVAVRAPGGGREVIGVQARGGQAASCRAILRPGHRVAVEGRVAPGARPAEVLAERVQFLTTRAEAASLAAA